MWELNTAIQAYNQSVKERAREQLALCWQTANFTGAAFAGKLKRLTHYLKDDSKHSAPKVSREEFERRLAEAKRSEKHVLS